MNLVPGIGRGSCAGEVGRVVGCTAAAKGSVPRAPVEDQGNPQVEDEDECHRGNEKDAGGEDGQQLAGNIRLVKWDPTPC